MYIDIFGYAINKILTLIFFLDTSSQKKKKKKTQVNFNTKYMSKKKCKFKIQK